MNYYAMKRQVFQYIDKLYSQGVNEILIVYKVTTKYGVSEKVVTERLDMLDKVNEVKTK